MAIPVTPKPQYPNVPRDPGVPPVPRQPGIVVAQNTAVLLAADVAGILRLFLGPQWGLFDSAGQSPFQAIPGFAGALASGAVRILGGGGLSVGNVEFRNDNRISTAPQERGAFLSYNKVSTPFNGRVSYVISGLASQKGAFLAACKAQLDGLELLKLTMPEYTWPSCNVIHYDLRRDAKAISMFAVDIWVEEVRETGTAAFTTTATPSGTGQVNGGTVQPATPTPAQAATVDIGLPRIVN